MVNLNEEQKNIILKKENGNIIIDGIKYYYKLAKPTLEGIENVVEDLAKLVDINCAHYEMIDIDGMYFYLSKDIGYKYKFVKAKDIFRDNTSLYDIWNILEEKNIKNLYEVMYKIIKIFLFDILIINPDRHFTNWGFIVDNDNILDVCILDNEYAFNFSHLYMKTEENNKLYNIPKKYKDGINELFNYLNISSSEYIDLFALMYNKINPDVVSKLLDLYIPFEEDRVDIKEVFKENYNLITSILNINNIKVKM